MQLLLSLCWVAFVLWLILRALRQRNSLPVLRPGSPLNSRMPSLSVIVPARNEAANLPVCLSSLQAQDYPREKLNIIVVDDNSTDETFQIGSTIAGRCANSQLVRSPALPMNWVGKPHACWVGSSLVRPEDEWLCFIDADVRANCKLISSAIAAADSQQLSLLSLLPRQQLGSFAERLVIPCGLFLMAFCQDLETVQARRSRQTTVSGQFMLVKRAIYHSVGGHAAVRNSICEDIDLALLVKNAGGNVILYDGKDLLAARMYTGWTTLWTGLSKNLVVTLGGAKATVIIALVVLLLTLTSILLPAAQATWCVSGAAACAALVPALAGTAAVVGLHVAAASYFQIPFWYGLLFPLGYLVGVCLAMESLRRYWLGKIVWKGRQYP